MESLRERRRCPGCDARDARGVCGAPDASAPAPAPAALLAALRFGVAAGESSSSLELSELLAP